MRRVVRQRWVGPEVYVEVHYQPNWSSDGYGMVDVYCYGLDPRKAQYHKPKYIRYGSTHGLTNLDWTDKSNYPVYNRWYAGAIEICRELGLTSSDRRAVAS